MENNTESIPISIIKLRVSKETSYNLDQLYLNLTPDFQRAYEAWDIKLKSRLVETILLGRSMNPIWTIFNDENSEESEEILDGMHRLTTALDFLDDQFEIQSQYFMELDKENFNNKRFSNLKSVDKQKYRTYKFIFNKLDSSYRKNKNKLRDMYEILNRSSRTLNDFEFNKVLYKPFYDIVSDCKDHFKKSNLFGNKKDARGNVDQEIIDLIVLSDPLPANWTGLSDLRNKWYCEKLGKKEETVNSYLNKNKKELIKKLDKMKYFAEKLNQNKFFSLNGKIFSKNQLPYKFIVSRLCYENKITREIFTRHLEDLIKQLNEKILDQTDQILVILECKARNQVYQKKLLHYIDDIIQTEVDIDNEQNSRIFPKPMIQKKLTEQSNLCTLCSKAISSTDQYDGDHIIPWTSKGLTIYSNLQVVHRRCHKQK